jgi:hypothetical protein
VCVNRFVALMMKPRLKGDSRDTAEGATEGYDTNTKSEMKGMPQLVDFMVELSGIEPLASSLRTRRSPS